MSAFGGVKQTSCRGLAVLRDSDLAAIRRAAAIVLTPAPVRIGAVATSGYDFREGYPFAMTPRGEAACHSSSVSFTSFRGTQG
jgi:hypothetical protein